MSTYQPVCSCNFALLQLYCVPTRDNLNYNNRTRMTRIGRILADLFFIFKIRAGPLYPLNPCSIKLWKRRVSSALDLTRGQSGSGSCGATS